MRELLNLAVTAAKAAGKEILKHYQNYEIYTKADKSSLTSADLAANDMIMRILGKSGIEICSEESILDYESRKAASKFWLVDPLDGTKEFIARNDEFCVCIALIEDGRPTLGVIYIPISDEVFYSANGEPLRKNGEILTPSKTTPSLSLIGRNSNSKRSLALANSINFELLRIGSAIKFCYLAQNGAGIYSRFGDSSLWDIAAGDFLVEQSGGILIDLKTKNKPRYDGKSLLNNHFIALDKNNLHKLDLILEFLQIQ